MIATLLVAFVATDPPPYTFNIDQVATEPPPYTFNIDQSVTCPRDVNDAWYSQNRAARAPLAVNASVALKAVIDDVPSMLKENMATLHAPSAMVHGHLRPLSRRSAGLKNV